MTKALTRIVYKPDSMSTDEYQAIVNPEEYKKWKEGDTSIPLVEVVDSFQIFFSNQGSQGKLGQASNQQLEDVFGSSKDVDAMKVLLEKGQLQAGAAVNGGRAGATNDTRGSKVLDTTSKGPTGIGGGR